MVFKFVRVDCVQPYKIVLPVGKHTIGRGKFLLKESNDPRISRKHAELQVTNKTVTITSLHQNPCFYTRQGKENKEILLQSDTITLCHGDRFGVLQENYWFELIHCDTDYGQQNDNITEENKTKNSADNDSVNGFSVKKEPNEHSSDTDMNAEGQETNGQYMGNGAHDEAQRTLDYANAPAATGNDIVASPVKRHNTQASSMDDGTKKIKTEPENVLDPIQVVGGLLSSIVAELAYPAFANPGHSTNQDPADNGVSSAQPSQTNPPNNPPLRERCMYGDKCYRINPEHKKQFSHPQDEDWPPESRGDCPLGARCRRPQPAHWTQYRHPPDTHPPGEHSSRGRPSGYVPGMRVVRRNGNIYYINAHTVTFSDDTVEAEDSDGNAIEEESGEENSDDEDTGEEDSYDGINSEIDSEFESLTENL